VRALILADEFFASRERAMLERLEVGLADEGVRVIHAIPDSLRDQPPGGVYSRVITYSSNLPRFMRGLVAGRLGRELEQLDDEEGTGELDLIHVFGGASWDIARELAIDMDALLVLEVWRSGLIERALTMGRVAGKPPLLMAPDPAIEQRLVGSESTVRLALWGVHATDPPRRILPEDRASSVMLVGTGRDAPAFAAALEGLAIAARTHPNMLIFCDALAARRAGLWTLARKLDILDRFSLIAEIESRRDLLIHGDILVQPDAHGEQRSTLLEAMAAGLIVVAQEDPMSTILQDGVTARLIKAGSAAAWALALGSVLDDVTGARALGQRAHDYVRSNRRASDQVRAVLAAYEWRMNGEGTGDWALGNRVG
jgi:glycosyltransferase involved in cell wall biosynthesis